ncbi:hypothetical protein [Streptomyces sp. NPDC059215]|uniref:hypothetical protein n=1 Tax=Streptomyces sp. NPDC059215 TaxID=3346772 RepID=UPI003696514D
MRSSAADAASVTKSWKIAIPDDTSEVFRCLDGSREGLWGTAEFSFQIPQDQVEGFFRAMDIEVLPRFDVRDTFTDISRQLGRDVMAVKKYEAGTVTTDVGTYTVLVDEDLRDMATVYVLATSSG